MEVISLIGGPGNLWGPSHSPSTAVSAAGSNSQKLDISIMTAEGDVVTLGANSSTTAAYANYEGIVSVQASSVTCTDDFSLCIQGDLSKQETRDIAKAVHAYAKVLKDATSGRSQAAQAHARELTRLDAISSFDAAYVARQSFSIEVL